jgi:hypothetical protein
MQRIAFSLIVLLVLATGAKLLADRNGGPAAAKQPGAQSEIRTAQTAVKSHAAVTSAASGSVQPSLLPAWLDDPAVMDGSWRRWPSLVDF